MYIQALDAIWRGTVNEYVRYLWGGPMMVTLGNLFDTSDLPGFVAIDGGALLGAVLYRFGGGDCEVAALLSLVQGTGVGSGLMDAVMMAAREAHSSRLWLVTTNDNTHAIRFYQKRGYELVSVNFNGFEAVQRLKGECPAFGEDGIAIKHEFVFEMAL